MSGPTSAPASPARTGVIARCGDAVDRLPERRVLTAIMAVALAMRLAVVFALSNFDTFVGYESTVIARNLLAGDGYTIAFYGPPGPTAIQYPLYPLFLAALGAWFPAVECAQALIGALTCGLMYALGRRLCDKRTGILAASFLAVYPVYVYWTTRIQALTVEICLLVLVAVLLGRAMDSRRPRAWLWAGIVFGLTALARSTYFGFGVAWAGWILLWARPPLSEAVRAFVWMGGAAVLVIAPWSIRNLVVLDAFVPISTNSGYHLWIGNNPRATGSMFARTGDPLPHLVPNSMRHELVRHDEPGRDAFFRNTALAYMRAHPGKVVRRIPAKLEALWWFDPYMPSDYPRVRTAVYIALLLPALAGAWLVRHRWRRFAFVPLLILCMSGAYAVFYGSARFRYVIEWALVLLAATALRRILWGPVDWTPDPGGPASEDMRPGSVVRED